FERPSDEWQAFARRTGQTSGGRQDRQLGLESRTRAVASALLSRAVCRGDENLGSSGGPLSGVDFYADSKSQFHGYSPVISFDGFRGRRRLCAGVRIRGGFQILWSTGGKRSVERLDSHRAG